MKTIIAALAAAVVAAPLFAAEPTLEDQKHDSSLMMDGMKSLDSKVEASWVSKEQTEAVNKESAAILKEAKTEAAPAVAREKAALAVSKNSIAAVVPEIAAGEKPGSKLASALRVRLEILKSMARIPFVCAQACYELATMHSRIHIIEVVAAVLLWPVITAFDTGIQIYGLIVGKNFFPLD